MGACLSCSETSDCGVRNGTPGRQSRQPLARHDPGVKVAELLESAAGGCRGDKETVGSVRDEVDEVDEVRGQLQQQQQAGQGRDAGPISRVNIGGAPESGTQRSATQLPLTAMGDTPLLPGWVLKWRGDAGRLVRRVINDRRDAFLGGAPRQQ